MKFVLAAAAISSTMLLAGCGERDLCSSVSDAEMTAKQEIAQRTRSPDRAKFRDVRAVSLGQCKFEVTGRVEAQNAFGAYIEEPFQLQLEWKGYDYAISGAGIGERPII